jgi:XrtJ-associated TM-motif-TM protein
MKRVFKRSAYQALLTLGTFAVIALCSTSAHAQGTFQGCVDSPENPTLILAVLTGGAYGVSTLMQRRRAARHTRDTRHK